MFVVLGGFIRFCIQEYQKLTFTQTVSLQKQWRQFYRNPECLKESLKIRKVCSTVTSGCVSYNNKGCVNYLMVKVLVTFCITIQFQFFPCFFVDLLIRNQTVSMLLKLNTTRNTL